MVEQTMLFNNVLLLYHLSLPQHCCFSILFVIIVSFLTQDHYYSYYYMYLLH